MSEFPLRLENYFFTHQEVIANPEFIPDPVNHPSHIDFMVDSGITRLADHDHRYGITAYIELNKEKSNNPPYFFSITAFGIVSIKDNTQDQQVIKGIIETSGAKLIFGAIRERLADMTARGPWGIVPIDFIPIRIKPEL